ncbi:MAG: N-acetylmuramoyl-L-alanine amidase, partial [Acidobacteria bacterium]|nr:N-acetylmuramoyl-L-alanine amidase [Acidobacteriota bacterium]
MRLVVACIAFCAVAFGQGLVGERRLEVDFDQPVRSLRAGASFRALGMVSQEHFHARVRGSQDGLSWTEWRDVELGHEGGSLVWFDSSVSVVEVIAARPLRLLFIEPGVMKTSLERRRGAAGEPEVVSRAGWGCAANCAPREAPIFAHVTHLVVHHSAGANESRDWPAVIRSIWVLHVQGNGWNDIGYNYLVDPNGVIYEGRAGGDGVIGAHFSGVNTGTMGVCMVGTYSAQAPSVVAVESLKKLLTWHASRLRLDASGQTLHAASGLTLNVISGHRDAGLSPRASGTTECPGNVLYSYLPALRRDVAGGAGCSISLSRRNYCFGSQPEGALVEFQNPLGCEVGVESSSSWVSVREGRIEVAANSGNSRRSADLRIGGQVVQVVQGASGEAQLPCVARGGVVNGGSFEAKPVALGSIVSLFGTGLWREGGQTQVLVNGNLNAPVFAATADQVNFALPGNARIGSARVEVVRDGVRSPETMFWVTEAAPAAFVAQNFDDGALNSLEKPVKAGRPLVVYLTGIGVDRRLPWEARIGGLVAEGLFLGTTPGFIGLGQANLIVPEAIGAG